MTTRIMVIDDEPLICTLLEYQLGGAGYNVSSFQRSEEALLRLSLEQPDLILLDVMMPEISGWDLCRQIRACSAVPVIMLTAKDGDEDVVMGLTSGADDYIGKPFHQGQLVARIEAVLRRSQARLARQPVPARPTFVPAAPPMVVTLDAPPAMPARAPAPGAQRPAPPPSVLPRLGPRLSAARKQRGLSLHDAAFNLGVRWEFLQAIEQEEFSYVPRETLRQALKSYSAMLDVDLAPYMGRRRGRASRLGSLSLTFVMAALLAFTLIILALAL